MDNPPNVALIGFMAAGKTTVGRALAARLGYDYVDTDELTAAAAGTDIPSIFAAEGEAGFRARERAAVADAGARRRQVIACGGGVARDPRNVAALRAQGRVVLLRLTPETAAARILADGVGRPMIDEHVPGREPQAVLARVSHLMAEREPCYAAAADIVVGVDGRTPEQVVDLIVAALAGDGG